MTRIDIINTLIKKYNYQSYLEIGVQHGASYKAVNCNNKTAVDNDKLVLKFIPDCFIKTSDEFFRDNKSTFDIIFIDGLHEFEQNLKDIKNSLKVLNKGGTIVCHDMLPPDENHQKVPRIQTQWTGDCWKAFVVLRGTRPDLSMYVINTDYGCGIIRTGKQETINYGPLTWKNFEKNRQEWMNVVEVGEWEP